MNNFSYSDNLRAAVASCLPCFAAPRRGSPSNVDPAASNQPSNASLSELRSTSSAGRPSDDLEHLLRDTDSDALSLHSNLGAPTHRRARHRRRPKFSLTLFGYTIFGRPPIYLSDDDDDDDDDDEREEQGSQRGGVDGRARARTRALVTASSSTLDSDAAPLDSSTIERLTSPDHFAALAAQRESERRRLDAEEDARRKAERRARRQERKTRERASTLASLSGNTPALADDGDDNAAFEGFQGSGGTSFLFGEISAERDSHVLRGRDGDVGGLHLGDADDVDLGGELYARKTKISAALSASGSDSRSRTSASFSAGDASHVQKPQTHHHTAIQPIPYPHTEMHLPGPTRKKSHRASKRASTVSSATSQSTSTAPYTPVESIAEVPAVAAFPVPQERYARDRAAQADFPSVGLSGKRGPNSLDPRSFLAHQA